ncbi:SGNH/GDSL hydrolase family protein [Rhodococcus opacus]|uniref:SGNH/GDSL hydrolase family protein n=1 Tax=Rhodococcus opacus TaxID=37919 RepID=UPI00155A19DB|nr:SGNH/GDSL hydrolase family protein [Rhodococcus opacus]
MAALAVLWSDPAIADPVPDGTIRYVAMGDSRAAGPYLAPISLHDGCFRSVEGYPGFVAGALGADSFTNVSCSGATTENLTTTSQFTATGAVPPRIDALRPDTTLVTVSIGGNDIAWQSLVAPCYTTVPGTDAHCRTDPETIRGMNSALAALEPKVSAALAAIEQRAPAAQVLLVGHGGIFGARSCWPNIPTSDADAAWISGFFVRMNQVLAAAATATGARFVDVATAAIGHDACAGPDQRWFEGLLPQSFAESLHPTTAGMRAIAARVLTAWGASPE